MAKKRSKQKSNSGGGNVYVSPARKTQQRITLIFGIVLSVAMVASLILPLLTQGFANQTHTVQPTITPAPTLPPPPAPEAISFDETYLHPSGLFTVAIPEGWEPDTSNTTANEAQAQLSNADIQSVIELRLIDPSDEYTDAEALRDFFTESWLGASWRNYTTWHEDTRRVEDDQLVMDFSVSQGTQDYIARQVAYLQDDRIYVARVITLPNASDTLRFVLDELTNNFEPNDVFLSGPTDWSAYFDSEDKHIIRYPQAWTLTDAAPGLPATIASDDFTLRVEASEASIDDESAAEVFISGLRTGTEITAVEVIERGEYSGYQVSYKVSTLDGAPESGLAIILNADDGAHIASLRVNDDVDLMNEEGSDMYPDVAGVLESFTLLPELDVVEAAAG